MTASEKKLYDVFREVRTCFNQLKSLAEQLHQDLGVNPSMRAVMESMAENGQQTVPDIANSKGISRQHIQTVMNALLAAHLVASVENPAHKRSPLYDLTAKGRDTFSKIRERETEPLRQLAATMSDTSMEQTRQTLSLLNEHLARQTMKGNENE